jgi:hypothetical protein
VLCRMGSSTSFVAESANISQEGMLLTAEARVRPGDQIEAEFTLPTRSRAIRTRASVQWVDETGHAGIHFEGMAAADVQTLRDLVTEVGEPERRHA